jgi:hypothetical protein
MFETHQPSTDIHHKHQYEILSIFENLTASNSAEQKAATGSSTARVTPSIATVTSGQVPIGPH